MSCHKEYSLTKQETSFVPHFAVFSRKCTLRLCIPDHCHSDLCHCCLVFEYAPFVLFHSATISTSMFPLAESLKSPRRCTDFMRHLLGTLKRSLVPLETVPRAGEAVDLFWPEQQKSVDLFFHSAKKPQPKPCSLFVSAWHVTTQSGASEVVFSFGFGKNTLRRIIDYTS